MLARCFHNMTFRLLSFPYMGFFFYSMHISWFYTLLCFGKLGSYYFGCYWRLPKASFGLQELLLFASVFVCVHMCVCLCQSRACQRNNSSLVQDRTTKFRQNIRNIFVKIPIFCGDVWPWTSNCLVQNQIWWPKFWLPNLVVFCDVYNALKNIFNISVIIM